MKKFLLFALVAMIGMPVLAQDEVGDDVTKYVINAGFDEDLTFQKDGKMKDAVSTDREAGGNNSRSWAYIAADSTVYARPKATTSQSRPDGRKMEAVNGFKGRVQGWTMESNAPFPQCEWTYFGTVPYDLASQAVPIADDGTTYLEVPARPTEFDGGEGFVYLRAGWTNSAIYKQVVNLPCAKYRLEYWTININPNTSAVAEDLTKIVCRNEEFKDEEGTGLNAQVWTKHEFEFTPTTEFTMQFGYQAANAGSGGQPIVALDGIKLYKIGEADAVELFQSDCYYLMDQFEALQGEMSDYQGLYGEMEDVKNELYGMINEDVEELKAALEAIKAAIAKYQQVQKDVVTLDELIAKAETLVYSTDYPGKEALSDAIDKYSAVLDEGGADAIAAAIEGMNQAIKEYYASQVATRDDPADYSFYIQNPWFVGAKGEPTLNADGTYTFPNEFDEENPYTVGSAPFDGTSEGWYMGEGGGDQRLNWRQGRTCWNAWNNNFNTVSIAQDITGLPNGLYKVAADLITQSGMATDQHTFAKSSLQSAVSNPLTDGLWDEGEMGTWTTLTTEQWVIVADGKLTIGALGTGAADTGAAGWFCATNFKLFYFGEATEDEIAEATAARVAEVKALVDGMHFAADKAKAEEILFNYDIAKDLEMLNEAATLAETSEGKYNEIMAEGKTIPTVEAGLADGSYGEAAAIARFALDYVKDYIASNEATYEAVDAKLDEAKNYINTYVPVFMEAAEFLAGAQSQAVKNALGTTMNDQKAILLSEMKDKATVDALVEELKTMLYNVKKQETYDADPDGTDYTSFIQNPKAESTTGWDIDKGTGNGPTNGGEYFDSNDSGHRYFDSYNAADSVLNFYGEQVVLGVPNGTYTVGAAVRTSAPGAFIFAGNCGEAKADTLWKEIPMQTYTYLDDETGEEMTDKATNKWGAIWENACERFETMTDSDPDYFYIQGIVNANGGNGYGWQYLEITGVEVKDHKIVIGMCTDIARTGKQFEGTWFSVTDWTLTLTKKGDNSGWDGPLATGINEIATETLAVDGIYTVNGVRTNKLQRGLNVVVRNGKAMKIMVK